MDVVKNGISVVVDFIKSLVISGRKKLAKPWKGF